MPWRVGCGGGSHHVKPDPSYEKKELENKKISRTNSSKYEMSEKKKSRTLGRLTGRYRFLLAVHLVYFMSCTRYAMRIKYV